MSIPKSILKKSPAQNQVQVPPNVNISPPKSDLEARNLKTAIAHAQQIQAQKDTSLRILNDIEALSLLPTSIPIPAADIALFKEGVILFQPSDYAALLEERNVNGLCGYTLCANPPRQVEKGREWVRPEGERRFCSSGCAKDAMYVKAQLNETPAWERRGGIGTNVALRDEATRSNLPVRPKVDWPEDHHDLLAVERGESGSSSKSALVASGVIERTPTSSSSMAEAALNLNDDDHDKIEGYKVSSTKYGTSKHSRSPD